MSIGNRCSKHQLKWKTGAKLLFLAFVLLKMAKYFGICWMHQKSRWTTLLLCIHDFIMCKQCWAKAQDLEGISLEGFVHASNTWFICIPQYWAEAQDLKGISQEGFVHASTHDWFYFVYHFSCFVCLFQVFSTCRAVPPQFWSTTHYLCLSNLFNPDRSTFAEPERV